MSLFESQITNFVVNWEGDNPESSIKAKIENDEGQKIGLIKSKGMIKPRTDLFNSKDSVVLTIIKSGLLKDKFEIKDANGDVIAIVKETSINNPSLVVEDLNEKEILTVKPHLSLLGYHDIKLPNNSNVAKFKVSKEDIKKSFWNTEHRYICNFQINDQAFDKKILWGSFLSFLSSHYNVIIPI